MKIILIKSLQECKRLQRLTVYNSFWTKVGRRTASTSCWYDTIR